MRKRRSTVYVRPGKDVTLYVPADTPPEVCAYLNALKEEGIFSQGVMAIITSHVQNNPNAILEVAAMAESATAVDQRYIPRADAPEPSIPVDSGSSRPGQPFSLSQIFQQARKNAQKLTDPRDPLT